MNSRSRLVFLLLGFALIGTLPAVAASSSLERVCGVVQDPSGRAVAGASVTLSAGGQESIGSTDDNGRFEFEIPTATRGSLRVKANGFAPDEVPWQAGAEDVKVVLKLRLRVEQVTVTATRTEVATEQTPSVAVVEDEALRSSGAQTIDDTLRQVPGFSLFRRSGSQTSNPTAQGVSLRGVGASGASRALVLQDGIPLNDPFGGWVYWGRVPLESIERIEVVRGGASDLYGTDALGGAVNLIGLRPMDTRLNIESSFGTLGTPLGSAAGSMRAGNWVAMLSGEGFRTNGYVPVPESERGAVDTVANSQHRTAQARVERLLGGAGRIFVSGSYFDEDRLNGKVGERNSAVIRQLATGGDWAGTKAGQVSWRLYGGTEGLRQNFFAVAPDRNSEALTRDQSVPVQQTGFSVEWTKPWAGHQVVAGVDGRWIEGESDETLYAAGAATSAQRNGGRQNTMGIFVEGLIGVTPKLSLTLAARMDRWTNSDGRSLAHALTATGQDKNVAYADRDETAFSPRISAVYRVNTHVALNGAVFRAFRAPTLNELYRSFRVGDVLTLANAELRAERLTGGEVGAVEQASERLTLRQTFFWNEISGPVANVTLSVLPDLITRQRQNLGRTRVRGLELEGESKVFGKLYLGGGYQFADSYVLRAPGNEALLGKLLPQVPRHEFSVQARYSDLRLVTIALQGRWQGMQFDDDRNQFPLEQFFVLNAFVSRAMGDRAEVFVAAENLLNNRYTIGRTPVRTIAAPVMARVGLRLKFGRK
ncbi:MAG TPA: TonB-dependent receptor [Clostridia bacterium]|nr:TonB-dependent receptor [Clostridia bacterium]